MLDKPAQTWHVIATISGWERRVVDSLRDKGFAPYLPQTTETKIRRGRRRINIKLVMPSYVFVPLELATNAWAAINRRDVKGVGGLIKAGDHPAAIPQTEMDRVLELGDDRDRIFEWLIEEGKVAKVSNRQRKRQIRRQRYLDRVSFA